MPSLGIPYERGWPTDGAARFKVEPLQQVLERFYTTEAHFIPAVVYDKAGQPVTFQRRMNASDGPDGLPGLRALGYDVRFDVSVAEVDLYGHKTKRLTKAQWDRVERGLADLGLGRVSTRAGFRAIQAHERQLDVEEYAAANKLLRELVEERLGIDIWSADIKTTDWTLMYRLPKILRDEERLIPWIELIDIQPYEVPDLSRAAPARETRTVREASDPAGLIRAKSYVAAIVPPRCGESRCHQTLWDVALATHLFGCGYQDALAIVTEWVSRSAHTRREWTPSAIERTVTSALRSKKFLSGCRLKESEALELPTVFIDGIGETFGL